MLYFNFRHGIEVVGFASDGDSRLLKAMKTRVEFNKIPNSNVFNDYPICVQDTIHIGTKLRNRLLNSKKIIQMGNKVVSLDHINSLIEKVPKQIHGLVKSDVRPDDRMNFHSLEKIMDNRVIESLTKNIPDSEATQFYLKMCSNITSSFLCKDLKPIERVYRLWYSAYFFRCWRKWILVSPNHTLKLNFISSNAYACIEVNAQALIQLIVKLRSKQAQFLPPIFSSQTCEYIFRQMRSMGTTNFTKINFTINELLHMIGRVELMNNILCLNKEIACPKIQAKIQANLETTSTVDMPTDEQIIETLERARADALKVAAKFEIITNSEIIETHLKTVTLPLFNEEGEENIVDDEEFEDDEDDEDGDNVTDNLDLDPREEQSCYIDVVGEDGTVTRMRKTTFVWQLTQSTVRLSNDRLKRVQGSTKPSKKRKKEK